MARIAVTGAAGFIGANLVARLKSEGHWVRAVDVKDTPHRAHLYEQADEVWTNCDLRDELEIWNPGAREAVDSVSRVYHLAADHGGAGYFHGPMDYKAADNNLAIDRNVRRAAQEAGVERLFFASSACTYPTTIQGKNAKALSENDWGGGPAEACYGEAKRMSTIMFEAARGHGLDARSALFHTIYGPGQDYEEPRAKFPTAVCRKIIHAKGSGGVAQSQETSALPQSPSVEIWGDGTQVRTFLYIEDALDRIQTVMEHEHYLGPVNLGSDEQVTVQQCAEWAAEAAGVSPEWVYTDGPRGVEHRASDNTIWDETYGRGELTPAKEGFRLTYEWLRDELANRS